MSARLDTSRGTVLVPDPPIANALFNTTRFAWLWLIIRLYLGWQWLSAGWGKISGGTWASGESLKGFWTNAVAVPEDGKPAIAYDWYRDFILLVAKPTCAGSCSPAQAGFVTVAREFAGRAYVIGRCQAGSTTAVPWCPRPAG